MAEFRIIQGGMGIGVSNWRLAHEVSKRGQLGVVSGVGLAVLMVRRLQNGDASGAMRRALAAFPDQNIAQGILKQYYREQTPGPTKYRLTPMPLMQSSQSLRELTVVGNFVEVYLAKEGHDGVVGINLLEKIQLPTLASLYGAMLAGVDYVLMGAGIPRSIPGVLDAFAEGKPAELRIDVAGGDAGGDYFSRLDPSDYPFKLSHPLKRPRFLAIVASATLAMTLARKSNGKVDGFVVELPTAGGHNAPPRGQMTLNDRGEPVYGVRDIPDLDKMRDLELPFYLAGGYASPKGLGEALALGASGIQVGTLFAFCEESGIDPAIKTKVHQLALSGKTDVLTDPLASPTGFPFKVLKMPGTLSELNVYTNRNRNCDLGYLRQAYAKENGEIGYRCPAEPIKDYLSKGGKAEETVGRKCICNGLLAAIGLGQTLNNGSVEPPILTSGDDVVNLSKVMKLKANENTSYSAADVLNYLLQPQSQEAEKPQVEIFVKSVDTIRSTVYDTTIGR